MIIQYLPLTQNSSDFSKNNLRCSKQIRCPKTTEHPTMSPASLQRHLLRSQRAPSASLAPRGGIGGSVSTNHGRNMYKIMNIQATFCTSKKHIEGNKSDSASTKHATSISHPQLLTAQHVCKSVSQGMSNWENENWYLHWWHIDPLIISYHFPSLKHVPSTNQHMRYLHTLLLQNMSQPNHEHRNTSLNILPLCRSKSMELVVIAIYSILDYMYMYSIDFA